MSDTLTVESIVARIERLPVAPWHVRMRAIIASATFFDAFDALTIAFVMPALLGPWHLNPAQIGVMISGGYIGQVIGALGFGWLAERHGRLNVLTWTVVLIAVMSLACAFAWDFQSLFWLRVIQGLGLGGEVPIAATYINEFAKAERRGFFLLIYQNIFPVAIIFISVIAIWVVPHWGWQSMFVIGTIPAALAAWMRRSLPESPRWLAVHGRLAEADAALKGIEEEISEHGSRPLPPPATNIPKIVEADARISELLESIYLGRTIVLWIMWFAAAFVGYGITIWMPTIYRTVFHLSVQQSLTYSLYNNITPLLGGLVCAWLVDKVGRRFVFTMGFSCAAIPLLTLWLMGGTITLTAAMIAAIIVSFFAPMLQLGLVLYGGEIYPTRMRALGTGIGSAWTRLGTIVGPPIVGLTLQGAGLATVFLMFAIVAIIGAVTMAFFAIETRGRLLEEMSP
jgi:putative MFS transporter